MRDNLDVSKKWSARHSCNSQTPSVVMNSFHHSQFTILIGSTARHSDEFSSDIDIVRIGHRNPISRRVAQCDRLEVISYIDYDHRKFTDLYRDGSLFLYHIFVEGRVLDGDDQIWSNLKQSFRVRTSFRREITENYKVLEWLHDGTQYEGATVPYLAHACGALKNLAIYWLAEQKTYVFDKRRAIQKAFPQLEGEIIALLIGANNAFERSYAEYDTHAIDLHTVLRVKSQIGTVIKAAASHAHRRP